MNELVAANPLRKSLGRWGGGGGGGAVAWGCRRGRRAPDLCAGSLRSLREERELVREREGERENLCFPGNAIMFQLFLLVILLSPMSE